MDELDVVQIMIHHREWFAWHRSSPGEHRHLGELRELPTVFRNHTGIRPLAARSWSARLSLSHGSSPSSVLLGALTPEDAQQAVGEQPAISFSIS